ncbi:MAG TPA: hypothetical protein VK206_15425 [Anaerolineales bacterium]|nr:hypothetical protein [Anaerolineales bacterium]
MDDGFDFDGKEQVILQRKPLEMWDILSILVLVITACISLYFLFIFVNPDSSFNILPPVPRRSMTPTLTVTALQPLVAWTTSPTLEDTASDTSRPTFTALLTNTPFSLGLPTETPSPTSPLEIPFSASSVTAVRSTFIPHLQDLACGWFGVGGTVDDINNSPIVGIVVRLAGSLGGDRIELTTLSGVSPDYGKAGYEFVLGNTPLASNKEMYVQLLDGTGRPLSEKIFLTTSTDCERNLILVRFKRTK